MSSESSSSDDIEIEAQTSSGTRRSLFPPVWKRFRDQLNDPEDLPDKTGAHVTLDDLAKLAEIRLAANPIEYYPGPPLDPNEKVSGWVGVPDPSKFAPGTTTLSNEELVEEMAKGNIVALDDWAKTLSELSDNDQEFLYQMVMQDWLENRCFVKMENGKKVSFWDLYRYVHHNPEMKALAASRRTGMQISRSRLGETMMDASEVSEEVPAGLYEDPGPGKWQALDKKTARKMPWGLVGTGSVWGRRPTRWLWGADSQLDMSFGMYVDEDAAEAVLGPLYGGRDPREVLSSVEYRKDLIKAGPIMGMTFLLTAEREIPVQEACDSWAKRLTERIKKIDAMSEPERPVSLSPDATPASTSKPSTIYLRTYLEGPGIASNLAEAPPHPLQGLFETYCMLDPVQLSGQTNLMDYTCQKLRAGASILVAMEPGGCLTLQAMSPGNARDRDCYHLGEVQDERLCQAILHEFLGENPVDPEFAKKAPTSLLMFANGFKKDNTNDNPNVILPGVTRISTSMPAPSAPEAYSLPRVGSGSVSWERHVPVFVKGIRERSVVSALSALYQKAFEVTQGMPFPQGGTREEIEQVDIQRRRAANEVLSQGLATLGLNVQGLGTSSGDLFEGAQTLEEQELKACLAEYYGPELTNSASSVQSSIQELTSLRRAKPTTQRLPPNTQLALAGLS
ncbi:hypothetical protein CEUSTIGMA_g1862.t1 [Chlamydomonas eustigma]|uniref:Uncharacterized protein n=1 Tax=Chlamydomonas eustigma TaxID=1157962 RepID=A0A250WUB3_9CHLO|nr:hypothetical protein CEUSTIGMA_g1862.t1 [Chlamydomonas eustigma]|eukprot:GAX74414.1 hypothetical protein CEUSTIGMA_g1862.t1 [Chlamydomonas eustigma]